MDEREEIILVDEEGNEIAFYLEEKFKFEQKEYALLSEKTDADEEELDVYLFAILQDEDGGMLLQEIEDEAEYDAVSAYLQEEFEDFSS